ncbi:hypothetical protein TNCT_104101 [Trichonephila clavata]|uniref:Uncharacterized protein n=1 Tax=Trichonephila clavata TaxID=2740835 RepID=A0A8X6KA90_TRICU|nr:hypothetical protein TNCT_104101 [Trichonephila clavata]
MQATRKCSKEEQVKQSGTRYNSLSTLEKVVAKMKRNLLDSDSDNESINEESPPPFHQASKSPAGLSERYLRWFVRASTTALQIWQKKNTQYRYMGVCQSDMGEDGEIKVQFLTTIDGKRFTEIVNDMTCSVNTLSRSWKRRTDWYTAKAWQKEKRITDRKYNVHGGNYFSEEYWNLYLKQKK